MPVRPALRPALRPAAAALALALAVPSLLGAGPVADPDGQVMTMTFRERIIVRVPRLAAPPPVPIVWKEKRGPRCIAPADLAGAVLTAPAAIELVLVGNRRLRARLGGGCEPLDFYSGIYFKPAADGKICAGRDSIRARSGAACRIDTLRLLVPVAAKR